MASLENRLRRLEGDRKPCGECGWDGSWSNAKVRVVWDDIDGGESLEEEGPEYCPECGHQLKYIVTWTDLETEGA
jgi:predicted RNA-binding Zn-ribbon protein involved in translation (DUF1610 family)